MHLVVEEDDNQNIDYDFGDSHHDLAQDNQNLGADHNAFGGDSNDFGFGNSNFDQPAVNAEDFNAVNNAFDSDMPHQQVHHDEFETKQVSKGDRVDMIEEDAAELAQIEAAKRDQDERLRKAREKADQELVAKRALKQKGQDELNKFYAGKAKEIASKRTQNKEEEWALLKTREEHKKSKNPWEKIIDNVEIDARKYLGQKDVSRMRQAMIARKQDLRK